MSILINVETSCEIINFFHFNPDYQNLFNVADDNFPIEVNETQRKCIVVYTFTPEPFIEKLLSGFESKEDKENFTEWTQASFLWELLKNYSIKEYVPTDPGPSLFCIYWPNILTDIP